MTSPVAVFFIGSLSFGLLWAITLIVIVSMLQRRVENLKDRKEFEKMALWLVTLAVVLMYVVWLCCYLHQLHPLIIPDLKEDIKKEIIARGNATNLHNRP
eukprot:TRINITY_DN2813_c0_g3_i3.p1 TRINITY_DN2813_c0_g3~~TRINITY_DN2813_c0_g3_i3.p1  ORF type:complete len:100 (-),score=11.15 TRINITY_DN2813_c0_g3_i3:181-480(-)